MCAREARCVMCVTSKARYDARRMCLRLVLIVAYVTLYYRVNKPLKND